jgi:hypothetical protein
MTVNPRPLGSTVTNLISQSFLPKSQTWEKIRVSNCIQVLLRMFTSIISCSLAEVKEKDRKFGDRNPILTLPLEALCPSGKVSSPLNSCLHGETRLILPTHLLSCNWELRNKNDCKMHLPHKSATKAMKY